MTLSITVAHRAARNQASIDLADAGSAASSIKLYTAQDGDLLAVRTLAKPCGAIVPGTGRIALHGAEATDLAVATGQAAWAEWCDGDGVAIATGTVSDSEGSGDFRLQGASGTQIYAGGVVLLADGALIG